MSAADWALRNPYLTLTSAVLALVFGLSGMARINRAEDPWVDSSDGLVTVVYPGASARDVERLLVEPLEDRLAEIEETERISSRSAPGLASLRVEWDRQADRRDVIREIERVLAEERSSFPPGVTETDFKPYSTGNINVMQLALVSHGATHAALTEAADDLEDLLRGVAGVKEVHVDGARREGVWLDVDPQQLNVLDLSLSEVLEAVRAENAVTPGGRVRAGERELRVQTSGEYPDLSEIGRTVVLAREGRVVRLFELATLSFGYEDRGYETRLDGRTCVFVSFSQKQSANVVELNEYVRARLERFRSELPEEIRLEVVIDLSRAVESRLRQLGASLAQGVFLVGLVVVVFMGFRSACIVMIAVPTSFLVTVGALDALGESLNHMTIAGLVVALGLLVDNAIVVTESVESGTSGSRPSRGGVSGGVDRVASAVFSSTLTTVLAFAPLMLIADDAGDFIRSMPLSVVLALTASLAVAVFVTPLLCLGVLGERRMPTRASGALGDFAAGPFRRVLRPLMRRPTLTVAIAVALLAGGAVAASRVPVTFFPKADKELLVVNVHVPEGWGSESVERVVRELERDYLAAPGIRHVAANIGRGNPSFYYNNRRLPQVSNVAQLVLVLDAKIGSVGDLAQQLRARLDRYADARIEIRELDQGPPAGAAVALRIRGDDRRVLARLAADVERLLRSERGVLYVDNPMSQSSLDLQLEIDKARAQLLDVSIPEIDRSVLAATAGIPAGYFRDGEGERYPIRGRIARPAGSGAEGRPPPIELVEQITVRARGGRHVPLQDLASFRLEESAPVLTRRDRRPTVEVSAEVEGRPSSQVVAALAPRLERLSVSPGYHIEIAGREEERTRSFSAAQHSLILAAFGILAVLISQFRSLADPFIVLSTLPIAVVGALLGLIVTGHPMSFPATLGITGLIGIAVNNAILLVDRANRLHAEGATRRDAMEAAAIGRLRPIAMTTATTIGGLLPLTLSGASFWAPLGWAIIAGLAVSTPAALVLVPALYCWGREEATNRNRRPEPAIAAPGAHPDGARAQRW